MSMRSFLLILLSGRQGDSQSLGNVSYFKPCNLFSPGSLLFFRKAEVKKTAEPTFRNPKVSLLFTKWRQMWLKAMERRQKLQDALDHQKEVGCKILLRMMIIMMRVTVLMMMVVVMSLIAITSLSNEINKSANFLMTSLGIPVLFNMWPVGHMWADFK